MYDFSMDICLVELSLIRLERMSGRSDIERAVIINCHLVETVKTEIRCSLQKEPANQAEKAI